MSKYLINRILRALLSVVMVVGVIMVMVYSFLDKESIFATDPVFSKQRINGRESYMMQQWENFGYLDYVTFSDYMKAERNSGNIDQETYNEAVKLGKAPENDSELTAKYVKEFTEKYESEGYEITRLEGQYKPRTKKYKEGGDPRLFAHKDIPLIQRLVTYFTKLVRVDNIHYATGDVGERGLTFTWFDPAYGGIDAPYIWLRTPEGEGSWAFFERLLHEINVVSTPGVGFGPAGEGFIRLTAFGTRQDCEEAMTRLRRHFT